MSWHGIALACQVPTFLQGVLDACPECISQILKSQSWEHEKTWEIIVQHDPQAFTERRTGWVEIQQTFNVIFMRSLWAGKMHAVASLPSLSRITFAAVTCMYVCAGAAMWQLVLGRSLVLATCGRMAVRSSNHLEAFPKSLPICNPFDLPGTDDLRLKTWKQDKWQRLKPRGWTSDFCILRTIVHTCYTCHAVILWWIF